MVHVPGKDNVAADALSRWAYPASQSFNDISWHGSKKDDDEMKRIIEKEKREEKACLVIRVKTAKVRGTEQARPESGMSSDTRVPASGTSVPRKFEFSRSTEPTHVLDEDWVMHIMPVKDGRKNGLLPMTRTDQNGQSESKFMNKKCTGTKNCVCQKQ